MPTCHGRKATSYHTSPYPHNVQKLQSFLGLVNYYGKFISNLATILHLLSALLQKNCRWKWTDEYNQAFNSAEEGLASSHCLTHYNPSLLLRMAGDASAYGIGAIISHICHTEQNVQLPSCHTPCLQVNVTMLKWKKRPFHLCLV